MSFFEFPHTRSYDSDLGWLIRNAKDIVKAINALEQWKSDTSADIDDLKGVIDDIRRGIIPEDIADGVAAWIVKNFYDIVADMIKTVWFGLTDSGYFVAYIPDSWRDIVFKTTGYDINIDLQPEYGHLVLQADYYTHSL